MTKSTAEPLSGPRYYCVQSKLIALITEVAMFVPEGTIFTPSDFALDGSSARVSAAFKRLAERGVFFRIDLGMYVPAALTPSGPVLPDSSLVLKSLCERIRCAILPCEVNSAIELGLEDPRLVKNEFLTRNFDSTLTLGSLRLRVRHAPHWKLQLGRVGHAIRALDWFGPASAADKVLQIKEVLTKQEWRSILLQANTLPEWMHQSIRTALQQQYPIKGELIEAEGAAIGAMLSANNLFGALEAAQDLISKGVALGDVASLISVRPADLRAYLRMLSFSKQLRPLWDQRLVKDRNLLRNLYLICRDDPEGFVQLESRILSGESISQIEARGIARAASYRKATTGA